MTAVVGDNLMSKIVKDQRRGVSPPSSMIPNERSEQPKPQIGKNGWIESKPLTTPPGTDIVDRIAKGFAEREEGTMTPERKAEIRACLTQRHDQSQRS